MKNFIKKIALAAVCSLTVFSAAVPALTYAEEIPTTSVDTIQKQEASNDFSSSLSQMSTDSSDILAGREYEFISDVSSEEMTDRIVNKSYQIADTIRKIAIPVIIVMFVFSAIMVIVGALSAKKSVIPGVLGLFLCGFAFVAVQYAPQWLSIIGSFFW